MADGTPSSPLHWLRGAAQELEGLRTVAVQRLNRQLGLPDREEFETQRALLEDARARLAALEAQVAALAARLDAAS